VPTFPHVSTTKRATKHGFGCRIVLAPNEVMRGEISIAWKQQVVAGVPI
jgi:hypothetical protein